MPTKMRKNTSAEAALKHFLTPEQKACFQEHHYFFVITRSRHVYVLCDGLQVISMHDQMPRTSYHSYAVDRWGYRLDRFDSMLAQLMMLYTNPNALIGVGCHNPPVLPATSITASNGVMLLRGCPQMRGWHALLHETD
jgi:hypothetical protein